MLTLQTMAPSVLTVVRAEDGSEVVEPSTEVVETQESVVETSEEVTPPEQDIPVDEEAPVGEGTPSESSSLENDTEVIVPESSIETPEDSEESEATEDQEVDPEADPEVIERHEIIRLTVAELLANPEGLVKKTAVGDVALDIQWQETEFRSGNENFEININNITAY